MQSDRSQSHTSHFSFRVYLCGQVMQNKVSYIHICVLKLVIHRFCDNKSNEARYQRTTCGGASALHHTYNIRVYTNPNMCDLLYLLVRVLGY